MCATSSTRAEGSNERRQQDHPQCQRQKSVVAEHHIRSAALVALHLSVQRGGDELRHLGDHAPLRIDDGGNAGVGHPEHRATGFQRAHLRDLCMLT